MNNVLEFNAKCEHGWEGSPSRCGKCRSEKRKAQNAGKPDGRAKNLILSETGRNCMKCGEIKNWDEFAKDVHGYNQKTATCIPCRREKFRQAYRDNPNVKRPTIKERPHFLKRVYGTTYEEVTRTLNSQLGLCANRGCSKPISFEVKPNSPDRAVIDHCHATGKFRAILCAKCNLDLGMIESNKPRFLGLMEYEAKFNTQDS